MLASFFDTYLSIPSWKTRPMADRGTIETDGSVTWSGDAAAVADELTDPWSYHFSNPCARTADAEWIATIAMKANAINPSPANEVRLYKRTTGSWSQDTSFTVNLNSSSGCGYFEGRDRQMCDFHVSAEPGGDNVYVFYVRTEPVGVPDDGGQYANRRQSLYLRRSLNGGTNWQTPVRVYTLPQSEWPSRWATVPGLSGPGGTSTQGFYRIGRVWSCISPDGTVHVVWFDNREGFATTGTYQSESVELDKWRVHRAVSDDGGATWTVRANVSDAPSLGGAAMPKPLNSVHYAPPGEFIACDASDDFLWIVWPDSRTYLDSQDDEPRIYLQRVARNGW